MSNSPRTEWSGVLDFLAAAVCEETRAAVLDVTDFDNGVLALEDASRRYDLAAAGLGDAERLLEQLGQLDGQAETLRCETLHFIRDRLVYVRERRDYWSDQARKLKGKE